MAAGLDGAKKRCGGGDTALGNADDEGQRSCRAR
jgi:hypothetical protein